MFIHSRMVVFVKSLSGFYSLYFFIQIRLELPVFRNTNFSGGNVKYFLRMYITLFFTLKFFFEIFFSNLTLIFFINFQLIS